MLAPYWSNVDCHSSFINGLSKVFYHVYSDSQAGSNVTLSEASADVKKLHNRPFAKNFNASWVLVVTWEKLRPREYNVASQNLVRYVYHSPFVLLCIYIYLCNSIYFFFINDEYGLADLNQKPIQKNSTV